MHRCGHCKALAPHYEESATALKEKGIKLAKVNCVDEADFCQSNGIQGYPCVIFFFLTVYALFTYCGCSTLRVYRNGEFTDYAGPRKADGIISYMTK